MVATLPPHNIEGDGVIDIDEPGFEVHKIPEGKKTNETIRVRSAKGGLSIEATHSKKTE